jgi:hypothetical protein
VRPYRKFLHGADRRSAVNLHVVSQAVRTGNHHQAAGCASVAARKVQIARVSGGCNRDGDI